MSGVGRPTGTESRHEGTGAAVTSEAPDCPQGQRAARVAEEKALSLPGPALPPPTVVSRRTRGAWWACSGRWVKSEAQGPGFGAAAFRGTA